MSFLDALFHRIPGALTAIVLLGLLAVAGLSVRSWLASRDAAVRLAATVAAQQTLFTQAAARERQRDATLEKALAQVARAKRAVRTPVQAARKIPKLLPMLPRPIHIKLPAPQSGTAAPPAVAQVPREDLKPLYDYLQDSRVCDLKLGTAQANLRDERARLSAAITERNAALRAAHGGGFWSHLGHAAKWFLIGGAVGALAAAAARR